MYADTKLPPARNWEPDLHLSLKTVGKAMRILRPKTVMTPLLPASCLMFYGIPLLLSIIPRQNRFTVEIAVCKLPLLERTVSFGVKSPAAGFAGCLHEYCFAVQRQDFCHPAFCHGRKKWEFFEKMFICQ